MNEYVPDRVSHPGETLREVMAEQGVTVSELSYLSNWSESHLRRVINGKSSMSMGLAVTLGAVLGPSLGFWVRRAGDYAKQNYVCE